MQNRACYAVALRNNPELSAEIVQNQAAWPSTSPERIPTAAADRHEPEQLYTVNPAHKNRIAPNTCLAQYKNAKKNPENHVKPWLSGRFQFTSNSEGDRKTGNLLFLYSL